MNEYSIKVQIPEGFEPDGGVQPRQPRNGDMFIGIDGLAYEYKTARPDDDRRVIIIKKKKPKYWTGEHYNASNYKERDVVDIKALEDCLDILDEHALTDEGWETYEALKELIK